MAKNHASSSPSTRMSITISTQTLVQFALNITANHLMSQQLRQRILRDQLIVIARTPYGKRTVQGGPKALCRKTYIPKQNNQHWEMYFPHLCRQFRWEAKHQTEMITATPNTQKRGEWRVEIKTMPQRDGTITNVTESSYFRCLASIDPRLNPNIYLQTQVRKSGHSYARMMRQITEALHQGEEGIMQIIYDLPMNVRRALVNLMNQNLLPTPS